MEHKLDKIQREHIEKAAKVINANGVDKSSDWNEYYVKVENNFYPFKYLVREAYRYAYNKDIDYNFESNKSSRNIIKDLGYDIEYFKGGINYSVMKNHKLARIVWNEHGWVTPSGPKGKSKSKSYEMSNGYGHEEWNFNLKYVLGEYKYGFLEPINKYHEHYVGKVFNITLFTYNETNKTKYWVTTLENVEVIDKVEAKWALNEYKKNGWLAEMRNNLDDINLDIPKSDEWTKDVKSFFNIKFKASQIPSIGELSPIEPDVISIYRYNLMNMKEDDFVRLKKREKTHGTFENSGTTDTDVSSSKINRNFPLRKIEIEIRHGDIQREFMKYLQQKYGEANVKRECSGYGMSRIDISRRMPKGEMVYYEVKSYSSLLTSFRQGIGQLLEYCLYPDVEKAKKIVLVSDIDPRKDKDLETYMGHIGKYLNIPFSYICFDTKKKEVVFCNGGE